MLLPRCSVVSQTMSLSWASGAEADLTLYEKNSCCYILSCFGGIFVGMRRKVNALFVSQGYFFNSAGVPA